MKTKVNLLIFTIVLLITTNNGFTQITPQEAVNLMPRGINMGNTMECPNSEGSWGNGLAKEYYFDDYKNAGFQCVRIPVRWDHKTLQKSPFTINKAWLDRVDTVVNWGLKRGLFIIINAHHEDSIKKYYGVDSVKAKLDSIWSQISVRFKDKSDRLMFEMINEPLGLTVSQVNVLNSRVLSVIRKTNPKRIVIYSGNDWSNASDLMEAAVPADTMVIGYFHAYDPWPWWETGAGTFANTDTTAIKTKFDQLKTWSKQKGVPVIISETGAKSICAYNARMYQYATYVRQALSHGIPFQTWEDGGNFLMYNRNAHTWNDLKDILIKTSVQSPTALSAKVVGSNNLRILWTKKYAKADSFYIERRNTASGNFTKVRAISGDSLAYTDSTLVTNKTYYYRVISKIGDSLSYSYPISILLPTPVSVNYKSIQAFELYPNPAHDLLNIKIQNSSMPAVIKVYDSAGKLLLQKHYQNANITFPISDFEEGVYMIQLTNSGNVYNKTFIKN
jgi:hypothetical protein